MIKSNLLLILEDESPEQEGLTVMKIVLASDLHLLERCYLGVLGLAMERLGQTVNLERDLLGLNQLYKLALDRLNRGLELLSDILDRNHLVGHHMLLQSFQLDLRENVLVAVLPEKQIKLELLLDLGQAALKLQIISVEVVLNNHGSLGT